MFNGVTNLFNFTKKEQIVILILVILNISVIGYNVKIKSELKILKNGEIEHEIEIEDGNIEDENVIKEKEMVCVDIGGQVLKPGVYELEKGCRVINAVEIAGGFTDKADRDKVNGSQLLYDEQKIYIYAIGEEIISDDSTKNGIIKKVNINTATKQQLIDNIPGIGESKAESIIEYRSRKKFESVEELININGIKEKTLENISKYIYVQ